MQLKWALAWSALATVGFAATPSQALDSFHATRSELLVERKHSAVLTL